MKTFTECNAIADCSAFFVRDCIRRAEEIELKLERGMVDPRHVGWAKAKAETYRAEAAEEMRHGR